MKFIIMIPISLSSYILLFQITRFVKLIYKYNYIYLKIKYLLHMSLKLLDILTRRKRKCVISNQRYWWGRILQKMW
jgi:hypothetical protein